MAYCKVWLCTSAGHWKQAKQVKLCYGANRWHTAKGIWWHQAGSWNRHCAFVKPTVGRASSLTAAIHATGTIKATATHYDTLTWQIKLGAEAWKITSMHTLSYYIRHFPISWQGAYLRLVATNAWGSTTGATGRVTLRNPLPVFTVQPSDNYGTNGAHGYTYFRASGYTRIVWYKKIGTGGWTVLPVSSTSSLSRTLNLGNLSDTSQKYLYKVRLYNATGQYIDSREVHIHMGSADPQHMVRKGTVSLAGRVRIIYYATVPRPPSNWASYVTVLKNGVPVSGSLSGLVYRNSGRLIEFNAPVTSAPGNWAVRFDRGFYGSNIAGIYTLVRV